MQIELRPLSFGEVLDRTIQIYRSRFPVFAGIMSVGAGLLLLLQAGQLFLSRAGRIGHHHLSAAIMMMFVGGLLLICLSFIVIVGYIVVLAAMFRAVGDMYTGVPAGVKRAYSATWRHWFRYLRLYISIGLIAMAPVLVPAMALGGIAVTTPYIRSTAGTGMLVALFAGAGLLLAVGVAFSMWLSFRYILAGSVCVFENVGVAQSMRRSGSLSKGQRWRIFVLFFLTALIQWCVVALFMVPVFPMIMLHRGSAPIVVTIAMLFATFICRILAEPILWIGLMVCYFDARIRREGFDVEWMLQNSAGTRANPEIAPSALPQPEITGLNPA